MRRLFPLLLLLCPVLAQEAPAPETPTTAEPEARPEWRIEEPPSNPVGDAVELKPVLEEGMAHVFGAEITTRMSGPMEMNMKMGFGGRLMIVGRERDQYIFDFPFEITKMEVNGADMTQTMAEMMGPVKLHGRLDAKGQPVQGTVKAVGVPPQMQQMAQQIESQMSNFLGYWPEKPVRVGETWKVPLAVMQRQLGSAMTGATVEGDAWQMLVALEQHGGVNCARVKTIMGLRVHGDKLQMQAGMPPMKADIKAKGSFTQWLGRDGYTRGGEGDMQMTFDADAGMGPVTMKMDMQMKMTGHPEKIEEELEEPLGED